MLAYCPTQNLTLFCYCCYYLNLSTLQNFVMKNTQILLSSSSNCNHLDHQKRLFENFVFKNQDVKFFQFLYIFSQANTKCIVLWRGKNLGAFLNFLFTFYSLFFKTFIVYFETLSLDFRTIFVTFLILTCCIKY